MGQKSSDRRAIALCPLHHQHGGYGVAFHAGPRKFEDNFDTEEGLLLWMLQEILGDGSDDRDSESIDERNVGEGEGSDISRA